MAALRAGSIVRYQANVIIPGDAMGSAVTKAGIQAKITQAASAKGAQLVGYSASYDGDGNGNVQANIKTNIDRASINDLQYDMDSAIQSAGANIRASAVQLTSVGGQVPGTIPQTIQQDTYHNQNTVLGTALDFWSTELGKQVQGMLDTLSKGSPLMWLGIGAVALLIFTNRK